MALDTASGVHLSLGRGSGGLRAHTRDTAVRSTHGRSPAPPAASAGSWGGHPPGAVARPDLGPALQAAREMVAPVTRLTTCFDAVGRKRAAAHMARQLAGPTRSAASPTSR